MEVESKKRSVGKDKIIKSMKREDRDEIRKEQYEEPKLEINRDRDKRKDPHPGIFVDINPIIYDENNYKKKPIIWQ